MGIDRLTGYIISTRDDIVIDYGGPSKDNGKYAGYITLGEDDNYRPLVSTTPCFDSKEKAIERMTALVAEVREIIKKETNGKHPIDHIMGETKEAKVVKEIITKSKEKHE